MNQSNIKISQTVYDFLTQGISDIVALINNPEFVLNIFNSLCVIIVCVGIIGVFAVWSEYMQETLIFRKTNTKKSDINFFKDVLFKELYRNVIDLQTDKGKTPESAEKIVMIYLGVVGFVAIFMIFVKQYFFAVLAPILLLWVGGKMTGMMKKSQDDYIQEQLPLALDNIVRTFTKYNDLRTILYESTGTLKQPMQGMIRNLANDMLNRSPDAVLEDFADDTNNIWINSMCFILLNYLGATPKKEVVENLRNLRDIITRDNKARNKERLERKMTVAINYALCFIALAGFIGNLLINPMAKDFFFSTAVGLICFVAGLSCLTLSIFSNLLIGSGK